MKQDLMRIIYKLFIVLMVLCTSESYAQDIIQMRNGQQVKAEILEIKNDSISCILTGRKTSDPYMIAKSAVKYIEYADGTQVIFQTPLEKQQSDANAPLKFKTGFLFGNLKCYQNDQRISKQKFYEILGTNQESFESFKRANTKRQIGLSIGYIAGFIFGYNVGTLVRTGKLANGTATMVSGGVSILSLVLEYAGKNQMELAVYRFNKNRLGSIQPNLTRNGIGLAWQF